MITVLTIFQRVVLLTMLERKGLMSEMGWASATVLKKSRILSRLLRIRKQNLLIVLLNSCALELSVNLERNIQSLNRKKSHQIRRELLQSIIMVYVVSNFDKHINLAFIERISDKTGVSPVSSWFFLLFVEKSTLNKGRFRAMVNDIVSFWNKNVYVKKSSNCLNYNYVENRIFSRLCEANQQNVFSNPDQAGHIKKCWCLRWPLVSGFGRSKFQMSWLLL